MLSIRYDMTKIFEKEKVRDRLDNYRRMRPFIEIKELLAIAICTIPYGIVVNRILVPHAIVGGGLTGFCEILYFATHGTLPIWLTTFFFNGMLLLFAIRSVGWKFCVRTIYGVGCLTLWFKLIPIPAVPEVTDPFMAVILAGLFNGSALGFVFLNNGSSGGTDIIAMMANKYLHISIGRVLLACDLLIISSAYFLPEVHSVEKVLFGLCYTFMLTTAIDWVMNRTRQSVQFLIFSKYYREIADAIMSNVHRGCTILEAEGGFSHESRKVVTVLARKNESAKIFRLVRSIDPNAFVSQSAVNGVFGQGFDSIKEKA